MAKSARKQQKRLEARQNGHSKIEKTNHATHKPGSQNRNKK